MKKLSFMIVAAGLLATTGTMYSCKKEVVKVQANSTDVKNLRVIGDDTAANLAIQVNDFAFYSDSLLNNNAPGVPNSLSNSLNTENAIGLLENTYNFIFIEDAINCLEDTTITVVETIIKNNSNNIEILDLATSYNSTFNSLKKCL